MWGKGSRLKTVDDSCRYSLYTGTAGYLGAGGFSDIWMTWHSIDHAMFPSAKLQDLFDDLTVYFVKTWKLIVQIIEGVYYEGIWKTVYSWMMNGTQVDLWDIL
jgi:hypothetical protein